MPPPEPPTVGVEPEAAARRQQAVDRRIAADLEPDRPAASAALAAVLPPLPAWTGPRGSPYVAAGSDP